MVDISWDISTLNEKYTNIISKWYIYTLRCMLVAKSLTDTFTGKTLAKCQFGKSYSKDHSMSK